MKFIHCADIHLDSPLQTHLSPEKARQRNRELLQTFCRLVRYAKEQQVTAVFIAGDLFDGAFVSPITLSTVLGAIRQAENVPFLCLPGNHDRAGLFPGDMPLPKNLKLVGSDWSYYDFGPVTVAAIAPETGDDFYSRMTLDPQRINIVMLHGQISSREGAELVALPRLKNRHIRYLALGHLHSYQTQPLDMDGTLCYSGCLEGRGFDETGEKGFAEITVEGGILQTCFVPFASRTLHKVCLDITDLTGADQLLRAAETALLGIPEKDLVKLSLQGSYTLQTQKDPVFLQQMLCDRFYSLTVSDESRLLLEQEDYAHDISLRGEFIRQVMASGLSQEEKERVLHFGLSALSGKGEIL